MIHPADVQQVLGRSILADGYDLVLDLERSSGSYLVDARDGTHYLDMFTFFASSALGMNHPHWSPTKPSGRNGANRPQQTLQLGHLYRPDGTLRRHLRARPRRPGAAAPLLRRRRHPGRGERPQGRLRLEEPLQRGPGIDPELGTKVLHLRGAFHGRSGYCLSLTNTDPNKVARFPKFVWPRIDAPAIRSGMVTPPSRRWRRNPCRQARAAFEANPHDIACFIAEPIQGEGRSPFPAAVLRGDARPVRRIRRAAHRRRGADRLWHHRYGLGIPATRYRTRRGRLRQKTQVCGIMAGRRVDESPTTCSPSSSRINSTWGGNLADMVRSRRILEVIESEGLFARAARWVHLRAALDQLGDELPGVVRDVQGPRSDVRVQPGWAAAS